MFACCHEVPLSLEIQTCEASNERNALAMRGAVASMRGLNNPPRSVLNWQRRPSAAGAQPPELSKPSCDALPPDQLVSQLPEATVAVGGMPSRTSRLPHMLFTGGLLPALSKRSEEHTSE